MRNSQHIRRTFARQQDAKDCGVACLLSVVRCHGGTATFERLRQRSGTGLQGTSLLGLCQAARQSGLDAEGLEADAVQRLAEVSDLCILHVVTEAGFPHYVVFYGVLPNGRYLIGDPAHGVEPMTAAELDKIWQSKALLRLSPTEAFVKATDQSSRRRAWLLQLLRDDQNILVVGLLLGIVTSVLGLSTAVFTQKLIDNILPARDLYKLSLGLGLLGAVLLVKTGLGYLRGLFLVQQSRDFNIRLMDGFFGKLLRLPKPFFDTRKTGELVTRMNDSHRIQSAIGTLTGSAAIDVLAALVSIVFVFTYSLAAGAWVLLSVPSFIILAWRFNRPIQQGQRSAMEAYSMTESHYINALQGIGAIKSTNSETLFARLTRIVYGSFQEKSYALGKVGVRYGLGMEMISIAFTLGVLAMAAWMVVNQHWQLGQMVAVVGVANGVFASLARLMLVSVQMREAWVAFDRLFEFASVEPENTAHANEQPIEFDSLRIENLCFRFAGQKRLLQDLSLQIHRGELVIVTGESGRGKSILLQILQKMYGCESGDILVNGEKWDALPVSAWRKTVGVVPQDVVLFNGSLAYNICLQEQIDNAEAQILSRFLADYGFSAYFENFPQGYATILGDAGVALSGGQKQLVGLARALYRKPQLLLLDEATSAMDSGTEKFVNHLLRRLKGGMGILMVTHRVDTAPPANRVYLLEQGRLCALLSEPASG